MKKKYFREHIYKIYWEDNMIYAQKHTPLTPPHTETQDTYVYFPFNIGIILQGKLSIFQMKKTEVLVILCTLNW